MYLQLRGLRPLLVDLILYPCVDFFGDPECAASAEMDLLWKPLFLNHDVKSRTTDRNMAEAHPSA